MNDLHLVLLAVGAVLLVALFAYNKWQERQALKRLEASMREGVGDALLGEATPARRGACLLYTSPSPRDGLLSRMPSSA